MLTEKLKTISYDRKYLKTICNYDLKIGHYFHLRNMVFEVIAIKDNVYTIKLIERVQRATITKRHEIC